MRLYLVRHGETDNNANGVVQGRIDVPLNGTGVRQAEAAASWLTDQPVQAVYASPLIRTRMTAAAIAAPHNLDVRIVDGLVEMDVGEMDGLTSAEMRSRFPDFLRQWTGPDGPTLRMPGGETLAEVQQRARDAVEALAATHPDDTVVVTTHNFVLCTLLCWALGMPLAEFRRFRIAVASVTALNINAGRVLVVGLNQTCHLERAGLRGKAPW